MEVGYPTTNYVTQSEHKEFAQRIDRENERQNERLKRLESNIDEINRIATNTEKLAMSMEQMVVEQKEQGTRISKLEERDGEKWRQAIKTIITVVLTAAVTAALAFLGLK